MAGLRGDFEREIFIFELKKQEFYEQKKKFYVYEDNNIFEIAIIFSKSNKEIIPLSLFPSFF